MLNYPNNLDAEQGLLACLLMDDDASSIMNECRTRNMTRDFFYHPNHQILFQAVLHLYKENKKPNLVTMSEELKAMGLLETIGGVASLSDYTRLIETTTHASSWIDIVAGLYMRRKLMHVCSVGLEGAQNMATDLDAVVGGLDSGILTLEASAYGDKTRLMSKVTDERRDVIDLMLEGKPRPTGLMTGFCDFDNITGGLQPKTMMVLAARPSVGKTSLAMNIAENIMLKNKDRTVLFFSVEMDAGAIQDKIISSISGIPLGRIKDGLTTTEERQRLHEAVEYINSTKFLINDSSDLTVNQIRAIARQKNLRHKVDLIIVDYIQFIKGVEGTTSREQEVAGFSRNLKAMAKELDVPVIVLSQLNRDSDKNERRPKLSDLRDSGSIEQDADIVSFLWKNPEKDYVELITAKNRTGGTGMVKLSFNAPITKFTSLAYA